MLPKRAAAPAETHAATPEEVLAILDALRKGRPTGKGAPEIKATDRLRARTAVGLCFFAALRPGEARGLCWEDFDGKSLTVRRSIWHTHTTDPKTEAATQAVPVIEPLRLLLEELRKADNGPISGSILRGCSRSGKPLNLDNLSRRVVQPILAGANLRWHGWYSLRRGVATALASLTRDPLASKGLLRHTSLATTDRHYIKSVPENTLAALKSLEALCSPCAMQPRERMH